MCELIFDMFYLEVLGFVTFLAGVKYACLGMAARRIGKYRIGTLLLRETEA